MKKQSPAKEILLTVRWPGGGIRTYIRYVYRKIDSKRWRLSILAPESDELEILKNDLAECNAKIIPIRGMPTDGSSGAHIFTGQIIKTLRKHKFDLVHSHGFISGACTALPASIKNVPHILTSHDVINDNHFCSLRGMLRKLSLGTAFRLIDRVQSVSYGAHENLLSHFPYLNRKHKCAVIYNGIETERFLEATPRDLRAEAELEEGVFLIGFLGRFMAQKGFRYLVEAIDLLKQKQLPKKPVVMTFGDGGFATQEKDAIRIRGLSEYFRFMPFAANIASAMKGLDVIVMPSLWEACPLQPMEALVCGTPFIGTDCIGLAEVLQNTPATIVPKADANALAVALISEMKGTRNDLFSKFKTEAARRFDVSRTQTSIFQLYKEMTAC